MEEVVVEVVVVVVDCVGVKKGSTSVVISRLTVPYPELTVQALASRLTVKSVHLGKEISL